MQVGYWSSSHDLLHYPTYNTERHTLLRILKDIDNKLLDLTKQILNKTLLFGSNSFDINTNTNILNVTVNFLIWIFKYFKNGTTFDDLWNILYTKKNKMSWSYMSHRYILRSHFVVLIFLNLILTPFTNLNPEEFGCNSVDSAHINKCIITLPEM